MSKQIISDSKRTLIFITIIISCIASSMLATALTTALPSMIEDFGMSVTTGQWLTSGYSLAMGIMMPLTAFLINRFPTRKLYLTAMVCFIAGLAVCVAAPNFPVLMAGRVLQACGNGIMTSMAQVIILTIYPAEKKGSAMGWYGLSVGAAPVIAPTLAGLVVDTFGWRMIFYISIAIMAAAFVFALRVFGNVLETEEKRFDVLSFIISAFAFGGITLGIGNVGSYPFVSVMVLLPLAVGAAALMLLSNAGMTLITMDTSVVVAAVLNAVRCAAIGCLMMPLITWGTSGLGGGTTAHATALLTSLRTIAGAIGSAVFVSIMTAVGNGSAVGYGDGAMMHGLNVTFMAMGLASAALLLIAIFGVKKTKNR